MVVQEGALPDEVIGWLPYIKPKLIAQRQPVEASLRSHLREDLLLDHAEALRDAIED